MATIRARRRKDGNVSYTVRIRIKDGGVIVQEETKTFDGKTYKKRDVEAWASARDQELHNPDAAVGSKAVLTLEKAIKQYLVEYPAWGRSKIAAMTFLATQPLAKYRLVDLTTKHLIDHAKHRREGGTGPATVLTDFAWLRVIFKTARVAWSIPLKVDVVDDALEHCKAHRLAADGIKRQRRPELAELETLLAHFATMRKPRLPMEDLMLFALFSTRRQEEICLLRREDYEPERERILVRDMKDPRHRPVNQWLTLPEPARVVLERQPETSEVFFPWNHRTISSSFWRATVAVGIEDLHFHDLRHEGISRLFELGWTIPQVAQVSGHRSWQNLQRYTHLSGPKAVDRFADWAFTPHPVPSPNAV